MPHGKVVEYIKKNPGKSFLIGLVAIGIIGAAGGNNPQHYPSDNIQDTQDQISSQTQITMPEQTQKPEFYYYIDSNNGDSNDCSMIVYIENFTDNDIKGIVPELWGRCRASSPDRSSIFFLDNQDAARTFFDKILTLDENSKEYKDLQSHLIYEFDYDRTANQNQLMKYVKGKAVKINDKAFE